MSTSLAKYSTFGIGGCAEYWIEATSLEDLKKALKFSRLKKLPFFILGKGSNCLFDDRGFRGVVIHNRIDFIDSTDEGLFIVGAGFSFSRLGSFTSRKGWSGLEFASGIPGSVGGAVSMNAGANGSETCDHLLSVSYVHQNGKVQIFDKKELSFSYRTSPFQKMQGAIASATFSLKKEVLAKEKQLEIIDYRKKTQPLKEQSAGCIFRNPSPHSAGALIEKCGLKGVRIGDAEVSTIHSNFIVNKGKASTKDVLELIQLIQKEVKNQTNIDLKPEVHYIPYV